MVKLAISVNCQHCMEICWSLPMHQPGIYLNSLIFLCITTKCCWGGGMACMERDEKPVTRRYLWEWTSVTIDIKWRQQMMFFRFTDTNTCLQYLFTLFAGWWFYFYSEFFSKHYSDSLWLEQEGASASRRQWQDSFKVESLWTGHGNKRQEQQLSSTATGAFSVRFWEGVWWWWQWSIEP